jgi:hypothetical protein
VDVLKGAVDDESLQRALEDLDRATGRRAVLERGSCPRRKPISGYHTRKSVVPHYCPAEIMPTYVDSRNKVVPRSDKGLAYYLSSGYAGIEPA